jgi:hypothetical protein
MFFRVLTKFSRLNCGCIQFLLGLVPFLLVWKLIYVIVFVQVSLKSLPGLKVSLAHETVLQKHLLPNVIDKLDLVVKGEVTDGRFEVELVR